MPLEIPFQLQIYHIPTLILEFSSDGQQPAWCLPGHVRIELHTMSWEDRIDGDDVRFLPPRPTVAGGLAGFYFLMKT
jgi:hypothetical protein